MNSGDKTIRAAIIPLVMPPLKRTEKLQAVATQEEVAAFKAACDLVGLAPADTLRRLVASFVGHVRARKSVRVPLQIEFK